MKEAGIAVDHCSLNRVLLEPDSGCRRMSARAKVAAGNLAVIAKEVRRPSYYLVRIFLRKLRAQQAEEIYRRVMAIQPKNSGPRALYLHGISQAPGVRRREAGPKTFPKIFPKTCKAWQRGN